MKVAANKCEDKLSLMLSIIKMSIVVFITILIYIHLSKYKFNLSMESSTKVNLYTTGFFLCITGVLYVIWLIINHKILQSSNRFRTSWLVENILFISIISVPVYLSTVYEI